MKRDVMYKDIMALYSWRPSLAALLGTLAAFTTLSVGAVPAYRVLAGYSLSAPLLVASVVLPPIGLMIVAASIMRKLTLAAVLLSVSLSSPYWAIVAANHRFNLQTELLNREWENVHGSLIGGYRYLGRMPSRRLLYHSVFGTRGENAPMDRLCLFAQVYDGPVSEMALAVTGRNHQDLTCLRQFKRVDRLVIHVLQANEQMLKHIVRDCANCPGLESLKIVVRDKIDSSNGLDSFTASSSTWLDGILVSTTLKSLECSVRAFPASFATSLPAHCVLEELVIDNTSIGKDQLFRLFAIPSLKEVTFHAAESELEEIKSFVTQQGLQWRYAERHHPIYNFLVVARVAAPHAHPHPLPESH